MKNQTITLGDFELTAISDGTYVADGGAFFGIVPKVMWQRKVAADDSNRITVSCNSVLVRTGKQTVLIETGIGNKLSDKTKKLFPSQEKLWTTCTKRARVRKRSTWSSIRICILTIAAGIPCTKMAWRSPLSPRPDTSRPRASGNMASCKLSATASATSVITMIR